MEKKSWKEVFLALRNCVVFSYAWFVILTIALCMVNGRKEIDVAFLGKLLVLCIVGSVLFVLFFSKVMIKKKVFIFRLSLFMTFFVPCEIFGFYWIGIFNGAGKMKQWLLFCGIIISLYLICILIDKVIYERQGEMYTFQLNKYQETRRVENGK